MNLTKKHLAITLAITVLLSHTVQAQTPLAISGGGTGSTTQNFVDLTTNQTIAGNKTFSSTMYVNTVDASTQYNLGGLRFMSNMGIYNTFVGVNTGISNTTGLYNVFSGYSAGEKNTNGSSNVFVGYQAGLFNTDGTSNIHIGRRAGRNGTTGGSNVIIGEQAGEGNNGNYNVFIGSFSAAVSSTGVRNVFVGVDSGNHNTTGDSNAFVGEGAGTQNTAGYWNAFFGRGAGGNNTTGVKNTAIGSGANVASGALTNATAIGADASVSTSNTVVLGRSADNVTVPGSLHVSGLLTKASGSFKIDHPQDPKNKYLSHSFVESPDMMNVYNGNVTTDSRGNATVKLPDYFEALNQDFRYQLTVVGQFAQAMVLEKVRGNQFKIKTDKAGVEVSWQVTGIRHDRYAVENRIPNEEVKPDALKGKCLYAPLCGGAVIRP